MWEECALEGFPTMFQSDSDSRRRRMLTRKAAEDIGIESFQSDSDSRRRRMTRSPRGA